MHVRIRSPWPGLGEAVRRALEPTHTVEVVTEPRAEFALAYRRDVPPAEITPLVERLKPLLPGVVPRDDLRGADVELSLGDARGPSAWEVKLTTDQEALGERLRAQLSAVGFRDDGTSVDEVEADTLKYGGANGFARQVVRFLLAQEGIRVAESKDWSDEDDDLWIHVRDPSVAGKPARERYPVEIHADDYEVAFALEQRLRAAGFPQVAVRSLEAPTAFRVDAGPVARDPEAADALLAASTSFCAALGVDPERHPVRSEAEARGCARIELPVAAWRAGRLAPYEGPWPERWEVVVRTDVPGRCEVVTALADLGFRVRQEPLGPSPTGFSAVFGAASTYPEVVDVIRGVVETAMADRPLAEGHALQLGDDEAFGDRVVVEFPARIAERASAADLVARAAHAFDLTIKTPVPEDLEPLAEALRRLPWKDFDVENEADARAQIQFGGAPLALVEHVRDVVKAHLGVELPLAKAWGDGDDDIWVHVPRAASALLGEDEAPLDLDEWLGGEPEGAARPFLEVRADVVRLGPLTLRRRPPGAPLVPTAAQFAHYCLDARTAETLLHLAESVLLREPALLEGETSVSKTSAILYLAHLLQQPVVRLNLNGQTDTGELVGRYVPRELGDGDDGGRGAWRWQDGLVVTAMKRGWWVILDELNLAEPQILERLNPALEPDPMLVLTEHDNSVLGPGGAPIHPDFRLFATMNPAEYAGRSTLSPAYRDRWRGYRFVIPPGEAEYHAMLRFLVHGEQPALAVGGARWLGGAGEPPLGALAEVAGIDDFLRALARFHAALEEAVGRRGAARGSPLGVRRRERYVFSRRALLSVVEYVAAMAPPGVGEADALRAMRRALARYYLGRVVPGADQRVVARLLDAAGIGPATWAPDRLDEAAVSRGADDGHGEE